jgi:hypothetical protein
VAGRPAGAEKNLPGWAKFFFDTNFGGDILNDLFSGG